MLFSIFLQVSYKYSPKCGKYKSHVRRVGKFVLASVSRSHGMVGAGRNLGGHLTHPQLQQGQLELVAQHMSAQVWSISMEIAI